METVPPSPPLLHPAGFQPGPLLLSSQCLHMKGIAHQKAGPAFVGDLQVQITQCLGIRELVLQKLGPPHPRLTPASRPSDCRQTGCVLNPAATPSLGPVSSRSLVRP